MTDKKALKIIKRYIELKTRVEERGFPFTPLEYDNYMLVYDKLKKIKKEYKEAEKQLKKSLEILDILKSKIGLNYIPIQIDIKQEKYILTGVEITKQEYELLKGWIENDKQ